MYPETDIAPIKVDNLLLDPLRQKIPRPIEEYTNELISNYGLNKKLAEEIFDSQYLNLFREDCILNENITYIHSIKIDRGYNQSRKTRI